MNFGRAVLLIILSLLLTVGIVSAQEPTIVDIAQGEDEFSILVDLLVAADLAGTLSEGEYTVFAPTNDAFAQLPTPLVDYLLNNPDALTQVLLYHVVDGTVMSTDLSDGLTAPSLDMGNELTFTVNDMGVRVNDATVTAADISASNGVIHVIDTVLLPPIELPEVDPLAVTQNIVAAGSSTVFPLTERLADLFNSDGFAGTITVDSIGSGAGYERFCVNAETDIANASRPIRPEEVESCRSNGREPVRLFVAIDALAVAVSAENTFADNLTIEQLAQIFSGELATWADINPDWPAERIRLFSPGSDSGTYDYFVEEVFDEDETPIQNVEGIQFSEDDNVLVQGVEGSPYAIAYFGYAYFQENQDKLRAISIEGVEPNEQTGTTGEYPLSRPLFVYTAPSIVAEKPQVSDFLIYYVTNANSQLGSASDQIGYIPTNEYIGRLNAWSLIALLNSGM